MSHLKFTSLIVFLLLSAWTAKAQQMQFGVRFLTSDFHKSISVNPFASEQSFPSGIGIHVGKPYTNYLLLGVDTRLGLVRRSNNEFLESQNGDFFFHFTSFARIQNLKPKKGFKPYVQAGLGIQTFEESTQWKPGIHLGVGIDIEVQKNVLLGIGTIFTRELRRNRYFMEYNLGVTIRLGDRPSIEKEIQDIIVKKEDDQDGDGIPDATDECPLVVGPLSTMGCPDKDEDGIADRDDACPDQPGLEGNGGCPLVGSDILIADNDDNDTAESKDNELGLSNLDTDGDGIPDRLDRCPELYGNEDNNGCPKPDRDNDGVSDDKDGCPDVAGSIYLNGCPEGTDLTTSDTKPTEQEIDSSFTPIDHEDVFEPGGTYEDTQSVRDDEEDLTQKSRDSQLDNDILDEKEANEVPEDTIRTALDIEKSNEQDDKLIAKTELERTQYEDINEDESLRSNDTTTQIAETRSNEPKAIEDTPLVDTNQQNKTNKPTAKVEDPSEKTLSANGSTVPTRAMDAPNVRIHFTFGHAALQKRYIDELNTIANYLRRHPEVRLKIYGHTDSKGSAWVNEILSRRRAEACYTFLTLASKIDPSRISYHGEGEYQPISDNLTPQGRFINRRVVFDFIR